MKIRLIKKYSLVTSVLVSTLSASMVFAANYGNQQFQIYNQGYGDFPPEDIDQQIQNAMNANIKAAEEAQAAAIASSLADNENSSASIENKQSYKKHLQKRQDSLGEFNQRKNRSSGASTPWDNSRTSFSGPWDNNGSNFSMPWGGNNRGNNGSNNNRDSGFNAPWDNNRSSFSGPWNNNGSNFGMPGNNNRGSGFSMPWGGNNGSGFSPWGGNSRR